LGEADPISWRPLQKMLGAESLRISQLMTWSYFWDRLWEQFERDGHPHWVRLAIGAVSRASVFPTLAADLDGGGNDPRATEFVNRLEAGSAARLAAPPEMLIPHYLFH
jgi:hypothetical protein